MMKFDLFTDTSDVVSIALRKKCKEVSDDLKGFVDECRKIQANIDALEAKKQQKIKLYQAYELVIKQLSEEFEKSGAYHDETLLKLSYNQVHLSNEIVEIKEEIYAVKKKLGE